MLSLVLSMFRIEVSAIWQICGAGGVRRGDMCAKSVTTHAAVATFLKGCPGLCNEVVNAVVRVPAPGIAKDKRERVDGDE